MKKEKIILGIDPGTNIMGYGLIKKSNNKIHFLYLDVLLLNKINCHNLKLKKIFETTNNIIQTYKPDEVAIEAPFFSKNAQSMLKLGRAQGAAIIASVSNNIPITEYAPKKIKLAITGRGQASKEQVAGMLVNMLGLKQMPKYLDSSDGLAAAVCHALQNEKLTKNKKGNWSQFIKQNPERIQ
jgi:crossover junction endodeoxyribonuclease RuvC